MNRWIVELLNEDGDTFGHLFHDAQDLADFVRVNAADAVQLRITLSNDDAFAGLAWNEIDSNLAEALNARAAAVPLLPRSHNEQAQM